MLTTCTLSVSTTTADYRDPSFIREKVVITPDTLTQTTQRVIDYPRNFTREEYEVFFKREVRKHSEDALDCLWAKELGFHTIALKEIGHRQYFMWIPAKYVLTVWSDFKYKPVIVETMRAMAQDPAFAHV